MSRSIAEIEKDLMALPIQDWARIAADLIRSLDKDDETLSREELDAAWLEEIQRRVQDVHEGRVELLDAEQVMAELRARYPKK
ncbi:addiction module protein [Thiohalophilus thiocyanatoxydans]|uniref:Putative addiction module component (TIGR02574 family) n=1 Tax=Thiohalophilus thiocyanatoxydans TaxID=381308 RepID=A0A4R8IG72_9GAMM|nr:addiction module protein [Thiohalophilus thiocyanatoxydans]TDX99555.1 putative addiction module component (TIGR02574 family) [Thiohalophilus thiocyanatoxydans]